MVSSDLSFSKREIATGRISKCCIFNLATCFDLESYVQASTITYIKENLCNCIKLVSVNKMYPLRINYNFEANECTSDCYVGTFYSEKSALFFKIL